MNSHLDCHERCFFKTMQEPMLPSVKNVIAKVHNVALVMLVCFCYVVDDYLKPGQVRFIVCLDSLWTENAK